MVFFAFVVRNFVDQRTLPNVISIHYLQYFRHVGVFEPNAKNCKIFEFSGAFLRDANGEDFDTILGRFWDHFWRLRDTKIGKNAFQNRRQKNSREKVMRCVCAEGSETIQEIRAGGGSPIQ